MFGVGWCAQLLDEMRKLVAAARSVHPTAILAIAGALALIYAFPGYMNWDSADQLLQARNGVYTDWHAPVMAWYWHWIELVWTGPLPMLVLQLALFSWGLYGLARRRFTPRVAAVIASAVLLFPPVLAVMAVVWKDAQMAAWLVAGAMLVLRPSWRARVLGLVMLALAAAVRDNGAAALPPLLLLGVASWLPRRPLAVCAVAFGLFVGLSGTAILANRAITDVHDHAWSRANAIHDIAGTICLSPPMTDDAVRAEITGIPLLPGDGPLQARLCAIYSPRRWFTLSFDSRAMFEALPSDDDRAARRDAWFRVISDHPGAFLRHRAKVMFELLGLGAEPVEEPVCQTFAGQPRQLVAVHHDAQRSFLQRHVGKKFGRLAKTILFRPWAYLLVGLILLGYAIVKKQWLIVAVITSGVLYEASFALGAAGPPYRYSHWLVTCVCVAAAIIAIQRGSRSEDGADPAPRRADLA